MSWKTFSLRRKQGTPSSPMAHRGEKSKSLKYGDDKRIMLMNMVKEGKLSVDNAVQKAYGMGIASVPYEQLDEINTTRNPNGEIYNFGVYKYGKNNKTVKCILQIDCQDNILSLLVRGQKESSYPFISIKNVDTDDDSTTLFIQFNDVTEIEIDAGTYQEKNTIARLLGAIVNQMYQGFPIHSSSFVQRRNAVIKEGLLEKRGRSAAFLVWSKRFVRICDGELMYFKAGEETDESSALCITVLKNDTFVKKVDDNGFTIITDRKEYTFRLSGRVSEVTEKERDDWILAIQDASRPQVKESKEMSIDPLQQEQYLKAVVRSLNEELEQLGVMLNIIDAPIRASTQVKKVRKIVHSLNDQIQTGLLSWTMRNVVKNSASNAYEEAVISNNYYNQYHPGMNDTSPQTYSHLERTVDWSKSAYQETGYNMLNISKVQHQPESVYPQYIPESSDVSSSDYAKVNKSPKSNSVDNYYNLQVDFFKDGSLPPSLPPKLSKHELTDNAPNEEFEHTNSTPNETKDVEISANQNQQTNATFGLQSSIENQTQNLKELGSSESNKIIDNSSIPPAPPPPQLDGSIPPPPPLGGFMLSMLPPKTDLTPNCKLKPLFWTKVPDMHISSSIWNEATEKLDVFNIEKLEGLFHINEKRQEATKGGNTSLKSNDASTNTKGSQKSLLDSRKAQNFGIFLSGFKLKSTCIEEKLSILDEENGLTSEEITSLKRFQPTAEEIEMFKSFNGDVSNLPTVDSFMMILCKIPQLASRLDVLLIVRELPDRFKGVEVPIENLLSACKDLRDSEHFPRLLEYILSIGNYVNGGTSRGRAHGFKLSALVKLVDIRSTDKKHTLLQYIVEELSAHDRECLFCYKEMPALLLPTDASIKGLIAEVEIMKKDVQNVSKKIKVVESTSSADFVDGVQSFVEGYVNHIARLEEKCEEIQQISVTLKQIFGESPTSDFQSWLNTVGDFMKQLQRAVEDAEQKQQRLSHRSSNSQAAGTALLENYRQPIDSLHLKPQVVNLSTDTASPCYEDPRNSATEGFYEQVLSHTVKAKVKMENQDGEECKSIAPTKIFTLKDKSIVETAGENLSLESDDDELSFPTKSGYLAKLSGGKKRTPKWDKRFFEVTASGYLHYSQKKDGKLSGAIYLRGSPIRLDAHDTCLLTIEQKDREWKLRAENNLQILDWYNVINYYAQMDEIEV